MIPYADMFNHHQEKTLNHYMVNTRFEKDTKDSKNYVQKRRRMNLDIFED